MQVREVKFDPTWIAGTAYTADTQRSSGLHLSQIYHDIENTLSPRDEMGAELLSTYRAGGFLWERVFEQAFKSSLANGDIVRPGEWCVDGIIGSPDYLEITRWRVIECKCTWRSSRKLDPTAGQSSAQNQLVALLEKYFWVWTVQIKGYCRMVGSQEAILHVFFMNGDYRGSGPKVVSLEFTFTQFEINENWDMIKNHARKRGWIK